VIDVTNAAPAIQTVTATPDASGTSAQLAASVADDGGEAALTYTWSVSSSPAGATVSFSDNGTNTAKNAVATFNASGVYTLSLTSTDAGGLSSSETVDVQISATPTTITITPANPSVAINTTQQFSASVADQFGAAILNPAVTWSPGDMIDQSGLFSAGGTTGTYTITATAGGVSAGTSVVVYDVNAAPSIVSVNSTPATGTTSTLSVAATDDGGESALAYAWSVLSTPPGGSATFSANGSNAAKTSVATFTALGTYTIGITATDVLNASASSSLTVTVVQTPTVVTVAPGSATIPTNGVQQFNATVYDQFSAIIPSNAVTVTWSAGGSISQSGLYTAGIVPGTFPITATAGSASGNASITVQNTAPSITALNATPGIVTGTTTSLSATAGDDAGEPALTYTWSLLSAPIGGGVTFSANVSNGAKNATATFALSGTYSLTLTVRDAGGLTATRNVTVQVNQTATSLTLSPLSVTLTLNQTQQFTAKVYDQFGKPMSTAIGWSASSGGSISSSGLFTASKTGNFTVTASAAGLTQTATVKVNRK
jgi:PKD repeat protein